MQGVFAAQIWYQVKKRLKRDRLLCLVPHPLAHKQSSLSLFTHLFEFGWFAVRSTGFSRNMGYRGVPWQVDCRLKAVLQTELKQSK